MGEASLNPHRLVRGFPLVIVLLGLLSASDGGAQHYNVRTYTAMDGLVSGEVHGMAQDPSGRIWFATRRGLVQFDGLNWRVPHGVTRDWSVTGASDLAVDELGRVWAISMTGPRVVQAFDTDGLVTELPPSILARPDVQTVAFAVTARPDSTITLAYATQGQELQVWDGRVWRGAMTQGAIGYVYGLVFRDGVLLVSSQTGLWSWSADVGFGRVPVEGRSPGPVYTVVEARDGSSVVIGEDWLGRYDDGSVVVDLEGLDLPFVLPRQGVNAVADILGGVYIGDRLDNLYIHADGKVERLTERNGLISKGVTDILVDREETTWFTCLRGATQLLGRGYSTWDSRAGLLVDEVSSVVRCSDGNLWLGHPGGITVLGDDEHTIPFGPDHPGARATQMLEDHGGQVWIAADRGGLACIEVDGSLHWFPSPDGKGGSVYALLIDRDYRFWTGTAKGLYVREGNETRNIRLDFVETEETMVRRLYEASDGSIWVASAYEGVYRVAPDETIQRFHEPGDAPANNTYELHEEIDGRMLVASAAGVREAVDGRLPYYDGLKPSVTEPVYAIMRSSDGVLWMGTGRGVLHEMDGILARSHGVHGLLGSEVNRDALIEDADGYIWIGTDKGLSRYDSDFAQPMAHGPLVSIDTVEAGGRTWSLGEDVDLGVEPGDLTIRFSGVTHINATDLRFRTWLEGLEDDWRIGGLNLDRVVRYTNVPPGTYRFHVEALTPAGTRSGVATSPVLRIGTPLHEMLWVRIVLVGLLLLGLWSAFVAIAGRRYAHRLEEEVLDRTRKLEAAERVRRQAEADRARAQKLESLGVLAGGIAHDFNNLLMVILGNASLLEDARGAGPDERELLSNISGAARRARTLTHHLLTFAQGGAPVRRAVSLMGIVDESASLALSGASVVADIDMPDGLRNVDADPGQLGQVFSNLLINACQAMPDGGAIRIRGRNLDLPQLGRDGDRFVEVTVADDGPGIPAEHLDRIFEPYFTTKDTGSGLGLAISYSINSRHDGTMTVESGGDGGTIFRILLPATEERPTETVESPCDGDGPCARILVLDDEPDVLRVICRILERRGHEVMAVEEGSLAVQAYEDAASEGRPFDVVILDMTIPGGMGGQEALDRMRDLDPDVLAIVASGYSDVPAMADPSAHGFAASLNKPFDRRDLERVLVEVLAERMLRK